jgi:hypothetical protein
VLKIGTLFTDLNFIGKGKLCNFKIFIINCI